MAKLRTLGKAAKRMETAAKQVRSRGTLGKAFSVVAGNAAKGQRMEAKSIKAAAKERGKVPKSATKKAQETAKRAANLAKRISAAVPK